MLVTNKSLLGMAFSLAFCLSAYAAYVISIVANNQNWIMIAALIYFLPLFVDFAEDLQTTVISNSKTFWMFIGCFVAGILYLALLITYLSVINFGSTTVAGILRVVLALVPIVCIPIKAYPLCIAIMRLFNRSTGGSHKNHVNNRRR